MASGGHFSCRRTPRLGSNPVSFPTEELIGNLAWEGSSFRAKCGDETHCPLRRACPLIGRVPRQISDSRTIPSVEPLHSSRARSGGIRNGVQFGRISQLRSLRAILSASKSSSEGDLGRFRNSFIKFSLNLSCYIFLCSLKWLAFWGKLLCRLNLIYKRPKTVRLN